MCALAFDRADYDDDRWVVQPQRMRRGNTEMVTDATFFCFVLRRVVATAVQAVANIVKTSLGPVGLDKVRWTLVVVFARCDARVLRLVETR